jgi:hypothetical protein
MPALRFSSFGGCSGFCLCFGLFSVFGIEVVVAECLALLQRRL